MDKIDKSSLTFQEFLLLRVFEEIQTVQAIVSNNDDWETTSTGDLLQEWQESRQTQ